MLFYLLRFADKDMEISRCFLGRRNIRETSWRTGRGPSTAHVLRPCSSRDLKFDNLWSQKEAQTQ